MAGKQLFDDWPERYDRWFETPVGRAVLRHECGLMIDLLRPKRGETILDAGCGTGIFTREFIDRGADVIGIDISRAMLAHAMAKTSNRPRGFVAADMTALPFAGGVFDKTVSVAALEFVADARQAIRELFRVTRTGGVIVVATLNSLSPWADRRAAAARRDPDSLFNRVWFRSPAQLLAVASVAGVARTAVHFGQEDPPDTFDRTERQGAGSETGAFVAARWIKP